MPPAGTTFTTDISEVGTVGGSSSLFAPQQVNILDEERRLIDKVFSIVDRDQSNSIEPAELEHMFKLFGFDTSFLATAINRIMGNADKENTGAITPQEFYNLLSQKFEKDDSKKEMADVFSRMDEKQDGMLDINELHKVAVMLGETLNKDDIKDMIRTFKRLYAAAPKQPGEEGGEEKPDPKAKAKPSSKKELDDEDVDNDKNRLTLDEFYFVCQSEL
jgi:Ca2+-binding EF-hand superfamily protein